MIEAWWDLTNMLSQARTSLEVGGRARSSLLACAVAKVAAKEVTKEHVNLAKRKYGSLKARLLACRKQN